MAKQIVYINPTFSVSGDGTQPYQAGSPGGVGAFNAWGTGVYAGTLDLTHFWKDSTAYLQCAGTTYSAEVVVYTCKNVDFGSYDSVTGNKTRDKAKRAIIDPGYGSHKSSINLSTTSAAARNNYLIENMDLRGDRDTAGSTAAAGVRSYCADYTEYSGIQIIGCRLDGYKGTSICGTGILCYDNDVAGWRGCFETFSTSYSIIGNRLIDTEIYSLGTDTIVSDLSNTYSLNGVYIIDNDLVRVNYHAPKQGVYLTAASGTAFLAAASGPVIIRGNRFGGVKQAILMHSDNAVIVGNEFLNIYDPADPNRESAGTVSRIFTIGRGGAIIRGNRSHSSPTATVFTQADSTGTGTTLIEGNVFDGIYSGINDPYSGTRTINLRRNIFTRSSITAAPTESNAFIRTLSGVTVNAQDNQYWSTLPDSDTSLFLQGFVAQTRAQYKAANEPTARFDKPQLDQNFRSLPGAPTIGAGTHQGYLLDADGRLMPNPPSIGAYA
jgi:hypothetical protein